MHFGVTKDHGSGCHGNQIIAFIMKIVLILPIFQVLQYVTQRLTKVNHDNLLFWARKILNSKMHCLKLPMGWVARSPGAKKHMYPTAGRNPVSRPEFASDWDNDMLDGSHYYIKIKQGSPM